MADLRILLDTETNEQFYPYTHKNAVVDSNGNTVLDLVDRDLNELNKAIKVYKPIEVRGKSKSTFGAKIIENIEIKSEVSYTLTAELSNVSDTPTYIAIYSNTIKPSGYIGVITIPSGELKGTLDVYSKVSASDGYVTINTNNREVSWCIKFIDNSTHLNRLDEIEASVTDVKDSLNTKYWKKTEDISKDLVFVKRDDTYCESMKIPVVEGDSLKTYNKYTPYRVVYAYYNDTMVSSVENVFSYTVPSGVNYIKLLVYNNQKNVADTVVLTHTVLENENKPNSNHCIRKPRVTFIDDDGNVEFYTHLLPIMKRNNIPMVCAYMGDSNPDMKSNTAMMTKEQCKEVIDNGGEIIVHTNPDLTSLSAEEAERIVLKSKNVLKKYGFDSEFVVYSGGNSNPEVRAMVSKYFKGGFAGSYPRVSDKDRTNHDVVPNYFIHREHCGGLYYDLNSTNMEYFKGLIDECVEKNGWLVFILHSWMMPRGKRDERFKDIEQFELLEQVIQYIKTLESATGIKIVTASEGFEMFGNVWQSGDYLGYWNEMKLSANESYMMGGHSEPGCAVNKVGQYDFPLSRKIVH